MTKSEYKVLSGVCNLLRYYAIVPIKEKRRKKKKQIKDLSDLFINLDERRTPFIKL